MEAVTRLQEVRKVETRGGNVRYVVRDADGNEYTTFRPQIGEAALRLEGRVARLEFHEQQRGAYTNVYLDAVADEAEEEPDTDAEEAAWRTAVEAAPWLVGSAEGDGAEPQELFDALKPFKDLVAEDIEGSRSES